MQQVASEGCATTTTTRAGFNLIVRPFWLPKQTPTAAMRSACELLSARKGNTLGQRHAPAPKCSTSN